jgi:ABC-2 type transport system ATP-binding protein
MTVAELIAHYQVFYPTWDTTLCTQLLRAFELPPGQKLRQLSRGMRMKAALLTSLAYRPELLVLDEPFSGLDPLVRDEFTRGVLELTAQERWTVFISSHDIDEVERLADWIGVLDGGRLYLSEPLASLQARFRRIELEAAAAVRAEEGIRPVQWLTVETAGNRVRIIDSGYREGESESEARRIFGEATQLSVAPLSLREILVALARKLRLDGSAGQGGIR